MAAQVSSRNYCVWLSLVILTAMLLLVGVSSGSAGESKGTVDTGISHKGHESDNARKLAEDYVDLIEQFRDMASDYEEYLAEYDNELARKSRYKLARMVYQMALRRHKADQASEWADELQELQDELQEMGREFRREKNLDKSARKSVQLTQSLRRELELINESLTEDFIVRVDRQRVSWSDVIVLIETKLEQLDDHDFDLDLNVDLDLDIDEDLDLDLDDTGVDVHDRRAAVIVRSPRNHSPPPASIDLPPIVAGAPVVIRKDYRCYTSSSGNYMVARAVTDSLPITEKQIRIRITNPSGNLSVTGWDRDLIQISATVEVGGDDQGSAEALANSIVLRLELASDEAIIELTLPRLSDPHMQLTRSNISAMVPAGRHLVLSNNYGNLSATGLTNDMEVRSASSDVRLTDVDGRITAINSTGLIALANCSGPLQVKNSFGSVTITECDGDMNIANSIAATAITQSTGTASITSTGSVEVSSHTGDVTISNANGPVEVRRLDGNLTIHNSYGPLVVEDVSGSATLANNSSPITAHDVQGSLTADNRFAVITAGSLKGPILIDNERGAVNLTLLDQIIGPSAISTSFGVVTLALSANSGVHLLTQTDGGQIQSALPVVVQRDGSISTADYSFGSGKNRLNVSGKNLTILITEVE